MICRTATDISIPTVQIQVEAEKAKVTAFTPAVPKVEEAKPLKGRQVETKEIKQIFKEGCDVLNRSIEQKTDIAKKENLKFIILATALIATAILLEIAIIAGGVFLSVALAVADYSVVAVALTPILTIGGLSGALVGASVYPSNLIDRFGNRSAQQKKEIAVLQHWIRTAGELQQKSPAIQHLEQYALSGALKRAEKAQKRKEQDLLIQFAAVVQAEKEAIAQRNKEAKPLGIMQRIKEQKATVIKMRCALAHLLKKAASIIQP